MLPLFNGMLFTQESSSVSGAYADVPGNFQQYLQSTGPDAEQQRGTRHGNKRGDATEGHGGVQMVCKTLFYNNHVRVEIANHT